MNRTSEVILRNKERLGSGSVLLVNSPRDSLAKQLKQLGCDVRASTQDFAAFRWLESAGIPCSFDTIPPVTGEVDLFILILPREKLRLAMMLHACASRMKENARLWLIGENRAGIKSSPRLIKEYFSNLEKLDSARHCSLFEARSPNTAEPFDLESWFVPWELEFAGQPIRLLSLPGVFAHGRLDRGTALLLEAVSELRPGGKILDFACGSGIVGLSLLAADFASDITLLDVSALALESASRSLRRNDLNARVLASDGLSEVTGCYDWIISNPPFHAGVENDLEIARVFFQSAGTFLGENGRILIVFNRHLPYYRWLVDRFQTVDRLVEREDYSIICASRPKRYR